MCHGKTYFSTEKHSFFYEKPYFSTAKLTLFRQNLLLHGRTLNHGKIKHEKKRGKRCRTKMAAAGDPNLMSEEDDVEEELINAIFTQGMNSEKVGDQAEYFVCHGTE